MGDFRDFRGEQIRERILHAFAARTAGGDRTRSMLAGASQRIDLAVDLQAIQISHGIYSKSDMISATVCFRTNRVWLPSSPADVYSATSPPPSLHSSYPRDTVTHRGY
ncbi:hypothetical protein [Noviherbaspirillum saxi]|uniref:hypothetical protein n=1 Tax=Noviherbaspirillum saxi TaxID=2320863 RepID=UPI001314FB0B|nr:hypothetical protein [Noviherbaspirillum saxi]